MFKVLWTKIWISLVVYLWRCQILWGKKYCHLSSNSKVQALYRKTVTKNVDKITKKLLPSRILEGASCLFVCFFFFFSVQAIEGGGFCILTFFGAWGFRTSIYMIWGQKAQPTELASCLDRQRTFSNLCKRKLCS